MVIEIYYFILLSSGDVAFLTSTNSAYLALSKAQAGRPPFPSPLDLFIFRLPICIVRAIYQKKSADKKRN